MGTTSEKLTYLNTTKTLIKEELNLGGANITNEPFRAYKDKLEGIYKDFLANGTDTLWNNWLPKVTGTGETITLNNTIQAKMDFVYKGNTKQGDLPNEYTQVEYIESTGTQYINTGVQTSNSIKVEVEAINTFGFADQYNKKYGSGLIGARVSATDSAFFYNSGGTYDFIGNGSNYLQITKNANTDLLKMSYSSSSMTINCGTYQYINTGLSINITSPKNIYLFAFNNNGTATCGTYKIYKCKIYNNNTLVRDFVPCYNSSNVRGLYDLVNNQFYTNAGTGTFDKGNIIPTPDYPQDIQVVSGDNTIKVANGDNTEYEEHLISLGNIELCKIGDYQDYIYKDSGKWYLNKQIGKVVLDGSENWVHETGSQTPTPRTVVTINSINFLNNNYYSNYFILNSTTSNRIVLQTVNSQLYLSLENELTGIINSDTNQQKVDKIKSWLSTHNTTVYYVLATPTITEITDTTLISQLEAIKKSYNSQTSISQVNNDKPFILDVVALGELT